MPQATLSVRAVCREGARTEISTAAHRWQIDEPAAFGGQDTAPSPVDMLLGSLAGCICAAGNLIAREMGLPCEGIEMQVSGQIDSGRFLGMGGEGRPGFSAITVTMQTGADWPPAQKAEWLRQVKARCPVIDNLASPTALEFELT